MEQEYYPRPKISRAAFLRAIKRVHAKRNDILANYPDNSQTLIGRYNKRKGTIESIEISNPFEQLSDLSVKEDKEQHQISEILSKTSRLLKHEHEQEEQYDELKNKLVSNKDALDLISKKIDKIDDIDNKAEIQALKEFLRSQLDEVNHRLSSLDHKEETINEKIQQLNLISDNVKGLVGDVNKLVAEKVEHDSRMKLLEEKIKKDTNSMRKQILMNERRLREMRMNFDKNKTGLSREQIIMAKSKMDALRNKINQYKKMVPAPEKEKFVFEEPQKDVFDDTKLKNMYHDLPEGRINTTRPINMKHKKKKKSFLDTVAKYF